MPWRRFGVPIAVIVVFFALRRITSLVVDWAWFSSIGYVGVFWTGFITKAGLFVVVLAVSTFLLWANATLAYRFGSRWRPALPAAFDPGFATVRVSPGPMVRIIITPAAYPVIKATLARGANEPPPQRDAAGRFVICVEETYVDQLKALRRSGENYSDVILKLAEPSFTSSNGGLPTGSTDRRGGEEVDRLWPNPQFPEVQVTTRGGLPSNDEEYWTLRVHM